MTEVERGNLHFGEVALSGTQLVTSGSIGYVMVATGTGEMVPTAQRAAYDLVAKVAIPNMRYRNDIGDKLVQHDHARLKIWAILTKPRMKKRSTHADSARNSAPRKSTSAMRPRQSVALTAGSRSPGAG